MTIATVGVVGAGSWGAALALAAARAGREVLIWARDGATVEAIAKRREAPRLPGVRLPESIRPAATLAELAPAQALILAVPTQSLRDVATALAAALPEGRPAVSAAKGIERGTGLFTTEVLAAVWPGAHPAILSGPSFAADVGRGLPTAVTLAASDGALAGRLALALHSPALRVYHGTDPRGVEIGGAAKNVLAIAAGIAIGLGFGESARAALVARGFAELVRFGTALGARPETLAGLSGLGDLVLTCGSEQSRNFAFGLALGRGRSIGDASGGALVEGAATAPVMVEVARGRDVEVPIAEAVADIVSGNAEVREAVAGLLARPPRAE